MSHTALLLPAFALLCGCSTGTAEQVGNEAAMTSNEEQGVRTPAFVDVQHGGPWTVPVAGATLDVGVDTVSFGDAEEYTPRELDRLAEEGSDGFPAFAVSLRTTSRHPVTVRWAAQGEGRHPAGPGAFAMFTATGARAVRGLPSGSLTVGAEQVETVEILGMEDHRREPCEAFRIVFRDGRTGGLLRDRRDRPVIAHGYVADRFDPNRSPPDRC